MDDWKLKAHAVVKLKKKRNMFVSVLSFLLFYDFIVVSVCFKDFCFQDVSFAGDIDPAAGPITRRLLVWLPEKLFRRTTGY